jgi:amino acid adenylation domain-containing protein
MDNHESSDHRLCNLSPAKRLLFEQRIIALKKEAKSSGIKPREDRQSLPLSFSQEHILLAQLLEPNSPMFNRPLALNLSGNLEKKLLTESIHRIFDRHTVLRMKYAILAGIPQQIFEPDFRLVLEEIDLSNLPAQERLSRLDNLLTQSACEPFNITEQVPIRASLYRLAQDHHVLLFVFHHIAFDAWSSRIFQRELTSLYEALHNNQPSNLPALPIAVADFAAWERDSLQGDKYTSLLDYWKNQLADFPPALDLLFDKQRPDRQTYHGSTLSVELTQNLVGKLHNISQQHGVTLYMTMLAAFLVLLYRYTHQSDLVIGAPIAGRSYPEVENLIGGFFNNLPVRFQLNHEQPFSDMLVYVRKVVLDAFDHQALPFGRMLRNISYSHDPSRPPIFQVAFNMEEVQEEPPSKSGLEIKPFEFDTGIAAFDLTLEIIKQSNKVVCLFEYNRDLFEQGTIQRLSEHYCNLLGAISTDNTTSILDIPLLNESERQTLIYDWNKTDIPVAYTTSLVNLFQDQVSCSPQAVAFTCNNETLTYADLDFRSDCIAYQIREQGVSPGKTVGLLLERSLQAVVAFIAIIKCRAVYLPLDPAYPAERLGFIMKDADVDLVITSSVYDHLLQNQNFKRVYIDNILFESASSRTPLEVESPQPGDLAYLIYTSGSTGQPKGVAVPHRQIINRLEWMWREFPLLPGEVGCQKTSLSFVDSIWELLGYLLQGFPTVILTGDVMRDPHKMVGELAAQRVSRLWLIPPLLKLLMDTFPDLSQRLPDLKIWMTTGEEIPPDLFWHFQEMMPHAVLYNLYGTSEVWDATIYHPSVVHRQRPHIPIGRPIANTQAYVLDGMLNPTPIYVIGELSIGGDGLAVGYLNAPELNASRFVPNPFPGTPGSHIYRTGDLARYLPDGQVEFVGRSDDQLKIRGVRVELGEIEAILERHPDIKQAVVTASQGEAVHIQLTAHLVARFALLDENSLKLYLKSRLPDYMLPTVICIHQVLPLTPSGKIDRFKLSRDCSQKQSSQKYIVNPSSEIEKQLVEIWEQFLTAEPIGIRDDFFEMGGNSLLAAQMFHQIEKTFGRKLPLASLFKAPTIELQAAILQDKDLSMAWSSLIELRAGTDQKPSIFFVAPVGGNVLSYRDLLSYLPNDQTCYGLQAVGLDGIQRPLRNVREVVRHYIQEMRVVQPHGPYLLGGSSFGGLVSYEIAQQLHDAGESIALVVMIDTYGPHYPKRLPVMGRFIRKAARQFQRLETHLNNLREVSWSGRASYVRVHGFRLWTRINNRIFIKQKAREKALPAELKRVYSAQLNAARQRSRHLCETPRFSGRLVLFRASHQPIGIHPDSTLGWGSIAGDSLEIFELPGHHTSLIYEPRARRLAKKLTTILTEIQTNH